MNAHVSEIWRHPIKAHGREALAHILLSEGKTMPWDRRWAVAHEKADFDSQNPTWMPCANFSRAAKSPSLQAIEARCNLHHGTITLSHPTLPDLTIDPDTEGDSSAFIQWVLPISAQNRALPARLVRAPQTGMTDTDFPSISIINRASNTAVATALGQDISTKRWRANIVIDGPKPWCERDWVGQKIRIGRAELEVRENITRCTATTVSTRTGERDCDMLGTLKSNWGHQEFGVYAVVTKTGDIRQGDMLEVLGCR